MYPPSVPSRDTYRYSSLIDKTYTALGNHTRKFRLFGVVALVLGIVLGLAAYTNLSTDHQQYMRLCIPLDLNKLGSTTHRAFSCLSSQNQPSKTMATMAQATGKLDAFLQAQKTAFLDHLQQAKQGGRSDLSPWTLVVGNEAGGES